MTDRELIEAAAKAAGYKVRHVCVTGYLDIGLEREAWNPLVENSDAFRLYVQLRMEVAIRTEVDNNGDEFEEAQATCWYAQPMPFTECVRITGDPEAATRRAIVRAAAAMVKGEA
jgi:hypothetical protein